MTLGEYLNNYLNEHNMSMREFAKRCGISHTYISYIINGKTSRGTEPVPTIEKYRKIAAGMNMDVNTLLAEIDDNIAWGDSGRDDEMAEELQMLRDREDLRALLLVSAKNTPEQVRKLMELMEAMNG